MITSKDLKSNYQPTAIRFLNWLAINAKNDDGSRKWKYIINTGSSRSSKTWSIMDCIYELGITQKGWRMTAWRDTKTDCKKTVWKDWQKLLVMSGRMDYAKRNKTESIYNFNDSTTFEIHGTDDEETVHGLTQNLAWINEPYKISKETFDQIDMRADIIIIDWNPKTNHFIDQISKQDNAIVINSTYKDNPFCPPEQKIKIESYQPVSYSEIGQFLGADLSNNYDTENNPNAFTESQIQELVRCKKNERQGSANPYMWQVYGLGEKAEKPNKIYTGWNRITLADYLTLPYDEYYGLDFGLSNPTALTAIKYNDHHFYLNELLYMPEKDMKEGLIPQLERIGIDKRAPLICDSANPEKILELRRAGFNAMPAFKNPGSVFSGISLIQRASVSYTDTSINLEEEYQGYEWDTDRMGVLDKPIKFMDHLLDGIRYCCSYLGVKLKISI